MSGKTVEQPAGGRGDGTNGEFFQKMFGQAVCRQQIQYGMEIH